MTTRILGRHCRYKGARLACKGGCNGNKYTTNDKTIPFLTTDCKSDPCQNCGIPEERNYLGGFYSRSNRDTLSSQSYRPAVIHEGNI
jgi:hypothetical protein